MQTMIIDEAANVPSQIWDQALRLLGKRRRALAVRDFLASLLSRRPRQRVGRRTRFYARMGVEQVIYPGHFVLVSHDGPNRHERRAAAAQRRAKKSGRR